MSSNGGDETDAPKVKSRKPANTAFRQQRLQAFLPLLTPKTVLPLFFAIGIILAPLGGGLLYASNEVQNITIDYTDCTTLATATESSIPSKYISRNFKTNRNATQLDTPASWTLLSNPADADASICQLQFTLPNALEGPVLLYYKLTNFYQNHRRYVKSVSQDQLDGKAVSVSAITDDCDPLGTRGDKVYYPCGLIANSQFNDSISMPVQVGIPNAPVTYEMTKDGIAWSSASKRYKQTSYTADQIIPPPNWAKRYPQGYNETNIPNFSNDYDFQNWMRTAGLPTFSKLYYRQDKTAMPAGTYQIQIVQHFDVKAYGGTKSIVLSTRSVIGGRNPFLGIAYIVVGGLCVILGLVFTARHLIKPRKLGDHRYLTWNQGTPGGRHE